MNVQPVYASPEISNKAMIVYGEGTLATPKYREWDGSTLGSEQTGPSMAGTVHYAVLKSCPTLRIGAFSRRANEKMLVVSEDGGDVYASVWNSITGWGTVKTLGTGILTDAASRGFHVAYEQSSGDCIVVVRSGTEAKYWIWNGTSWDVDGATLDLTVTTGNPVWIRLAADPLSNETAMIWVDHNYDVGGAIWSGSSWGNQLLLDDTSLTSEMVDDDREVIAVEYMANNGEAMFAWGGDDQPTTGADSGIGSRVWNGASWDSQLAWIDTGDDGYPPFWLSLKADPNSNQLMLSVTDDALDLNTARWSGTAWDTPVQHDESIESGCRNSRLADVEWENVTGHSGHAIVAWNSGSDSLETKHWDGSAWGSLISTDDLIITDQHIIQLRRTGDGKIFASMVDDGSSLHVWYWDSTSGAWVYSGLGLGEIEIETVSGGIYYEPFEFAPDIHEAFVPPETPTVYLTPENKTDLTLTPPAEKYSLTLRPNGEGTFDQWYGQPGGTNYGDADYTNWDEEVRDDNDYNWIDEDYWLQSSTLTDSTGESWSIAKVKVTVYAKANISNQDDKLILMVVIGGLFRAGMEFSNLSTSFTEYSSIWGMNPRTQDQWTWSEIDNLEAGVYTDVGDDITWGNSTHSLAMYVSQLYVEVLGPGIRFDLCVDYIENCWQWQFEMSYNPDVMHGVYADEGNGNPVGVDPDGFLADGGGTVMTLAGPGWNNTMGRMSLTGANLLAKVGAVTGGGRLASFIMETVGKGETDLTPGSLTLIFNTTGYFDPILGPGYFRNVDKADLPTASFTKTPESPLPDPTEGYNMTFDASASTATGSKTIDEYKWYFGANFPYDRVDEIVIETDATIERNYTMRTPSGGVYNVTLTVKDSDDIVASAKHSFEVMAHDLTILHMQLWNVPEAPDNVTIGETAKINATVYNLGDYSETGVTVRCYYRVSGTETLIGTVTGLSVNVAGEVNATFTWNTAGLTVTGTYIIFANISAVSYEYVTINNEHIGIGVRVKPAAVPEFPLGAAMEIALATAVVYLWWRSRRRRKPYETYSRISLQALKRI